MTTHRLLAAALASLLAACGGGEPEYCEAPPPDLSAQFPVPPQPPDAPVYSTPLPRCEDLPARGATG